MKQIQRMQKLGVQIQPANIEGFRTLLYHVTSSLSEEENIYQIETEAVVSRIA
ncbi:MULTISPECIES: hypothetical protein [Bacillus]|uniref:hypothetical protein n=1 Tax=Bacillus sp. SKDU12 TaxID=1337053 RepID=UPI001389F7F4